MTDPRDAEIARLTAANNALKGSLTVLDEGYRRVEAERDAAVERAAAREAWAAECLLENECLTAERDAALAQVAGAYEAAAQEADEHKHFAKGIECCGDCIRALTPADALSALSRRDAQMRAEGMRKAAEIADAKDPDKPTNYLHRRDNIPAAILAAAEKEAGNG